MPVYSLYLFFVFIIFLRRNRNPLTKKIKRKRQRCCVKWRESRKRIPSNSREWPKRSPQRRLGTGHQSGRRSEERHLHLAQSEEGAVPRTEERPTVGVRLEGKALEALEAPQDVPTRVFSDLARALFMQRRGVSQTAAKWRKYGR